MSDPFTEAFSNAFQAAEAPKRETRKSEGESYQFPTLDTCNGYNQGTIIGRPLLDSKNNPFRTLRGVFDITVPVLAVREDKTTYIANRPIKWMDSKNYKVQLTSEQKELNQKLKELLQKLEKLGNKAEGVRRAKYIKQLSLFFMKVIKQIPEENKKDPKKTLPEKSYTNPGVTLMTSKSHLFGAAFKKACDSKTKVLGTMSWVPSIFGRSIDPTNRVMIIWTKLKLTDNGDSMNGYDVSVSFDESGTATGLIPEDLERSLDLTAEFIDENTFNDQQVADWIILAEKTINGGADANLGTTDEKSAEKSTGAAESEFVDEAEAAPATGDSIL